MSLSRRQFLKAVATSTVGAVVFVGCEAQPGRRELLVQSPALMPEDLVSGRDNWYATVCGHCPAGCSAIVRVMEGRAKKLEGNPDHPVNGGRLCLQGQAGVQGLYHPDRLRGPQRRAGDRGSGRFESISWDDALNDLVSRLRSLRDNQQAGQMLLVTEPMHGHRALVVDRFIKTFGGRHAAFSTQERSVERAAVRRVFGADRLPAFDLGETRYLLSFGADFLHTWLSPVWYGRAYGEFRQGKEGRRGYFVQVEPRMSATGANADELLLVRPGTEGTLALSLAQVILAEGLGDRAAAGALSAFKLDDYRPERAAEVTGVPAERIAEIARAFAQQRPSLAMAGETAAAHTNGTFNLAAVYALNLLVGSVGVSGGVKLNPPAPLPDLPDLRETSFADWHRLAEGMRTGSRTISLLMVHGANPVYGLPEAVGMREALAKVPYIVSFSSFLDETTAQADLILPDHHFLEAWGDAIPDPAPAQPVLTIQQPVVSPLYDTRGFADVLLTLADELGDDLRQALPWNTLRDALRDGTQGLPVGAAPGDGPEAGWMRLLQRGGFWGGAGAAAAAARPASLPPPASPEFAGAEPDYPLHLIVFPSPALGGGELAHLPWLQAAPDPVTTVVWRTWLEVSPPTARDLGLKEGDVVAVESPAGRIEAPVYVHPGLPPWAVAMPRGQGHTAYTQYASGRGVNPLSLLAPLTDQETGALAWSATRVRLQRTGKQLALPKREGAVPAVEPEDAEIVGVTRE